MIGTQRNRKPKTQAEPTLLSGLDTESNGKPLNCFKICVLKIALPGPATRLEGG